MDQISEGGKSIHEIDKIRKRLEAEKMELQAALEEAEGALEQEENKVLRSELELSQVRAEIERRIAEKDEEFQSTKKNFGKAVESMQGALEVESKGKGEALRMKKKLEADIVELETALEHANAANSETQKVIKKYHQSIRETQGKLEKEQRAKEADRARRITEQELSDTNELLSNLTCTNQAIAGAKRKLESELATLQVDLDEMKREASVSADKSTKAMLDTARLAEELRAEQEAAGAYERERKLQECQVKDMQSRLDDAEVNALKGGKKAMHKMESRIRELESEVDAEARRMADATKNLKASERHIKEISLKQSEDAENKAKMDKLIDSLNGKIESYKKQIEEAEEIASQNLTKYRQTQSALADATQRADLNEKALSRARSGARSLL